MRIKLTVSYDGTDYCGWQVQPNGVTIQELLEQALFNVTGEKVRITGSGRTDSGVHAKGQVAHFDTNSSVPAEKFSKALNAHLPSGIKVLSSEEVGEDFHACTSVKKKTYEYSLYVSETEQPLKERYAVRLDHAPDLEKMIDGAKVLFGEHDFKAFCASGSGAKTTVRKIYSIDIKKKDGDITVSVCGNGFLYNMVRIIVGALIDVGNGKKTKAELEEILKSGKREKNGKTLPAKGLCLVSAEY